MPCQGYLFSMSTIHFATFTVTGFCRICQFSLFSQVSAVGLHLDNFVSNAMPGLLVFHVHHTFSAFTVTGFCRICQSSLVSQVSALGVHLDNCLSNAMPGLLVLHVHHTFCNFHSDWVLQDLPTFFFSFVSTSNLRTLMSGSFHPQNRAELCRI